MNKKITSFILILALLAVIPCVFAFAEDAHRHPICGATCQESHGDLNFTAISASNIATVAASRVKIDGTYYYVFRSGSYYLSENITLSYDILIPKDASVDLCLNGKMLTGTAKDSVITVEEGGTLKLTDCHPEVVIPGKSHSSMWVYDSAGTAWNLNGGVITGGKNDCGGGINNSGTFHMYGGNLAGNAGAGPSNAPYAGGGVYNTGTFCLYGGTITGNRTYSTKSVASNIQYVGVGGGVYNAGSFHMYGGSITRNSGYHNGGGIFNKGSFVMDGGSITKNSASYSAGLENAGTAVMNGGSISNNTASSEGGGITTSGSFTMHGGSIRENRVYINSNYYSHMYAGGIYVDNGTLTITGGEISGNYVSAGSVNAAGANAHGGGIYLRKGSLILAGGTITGNYTTTTDTSGKYSAKGGGIYVTKNGTILVSGAPKVSGNQAAEVDNNIYLEAEGLISVGTDVDGNGTTEYLTAGALLQITPSTLPAAGSTFAVTTAGSGNYSKFFAADDSAYTAVNMGSGNSQAVHLMHHPACTGADAVIENETAASCTEDGGYDTVVYCAECGKELSRAHTVISAQGHKYGSWYVENAATCTEKGNERRDCANCDSHEEKDIAATGHHWDEGTVTREPTETATGEKVYTCANCSQTRSEVIPELSHTHSYSATATPPSCTEQGFTTHTCVCGHSYTDSYIAATGHQYNEDHICANCGQQDPAAQAPTEPAPTESAPTEPTEPEVTEPAPTEPTEPEATEPAHPTKPEATEPSEPVTVPPADAPQQPADDTSGVLLGIVIALGILCLLLILLIILLLTKKRRKEQ